MRTLLSETRQKEAKEAGGAGQVRLRPGAHGRGVPPWQRRILPDGKISCWMKHLHRIAHLSHSVWRSPSWSFEKVKSKDWNRKYLFETAKIWETLEQSCLIRWDNKPSQSKGFIPPSWIGTFLLISRFSIFSHCAISEADDEGESGAPRGDEELATKFCQH